MPGCPTHILPRITPLLCSAPPLSGSLPSSTTWNPLSAFPTHLASLPRPQPWLCPIRGLAVLRPAYHQFLPTTGGKLSRAPPTIGPAHSQDAPSQPHPLTGRAAAGPAQTTPDAGRCASLLRARPHASPSARPTLGCGASRRLRREVWARGRSWSGRRCGAGLGGPGKRVRTVGASRSGLPGAGRERETVAAPRTLFLDTWPCPRRSLRGEAGGGPGSGDEGKGGGTMGSVGADARDWRGARREAEPRRPRSLS